jgi:hypothetical protein
LQAIDIMTTDNVTALPGTSALPENPMAFTPERPGYCSHDAILIDTHTRTIRCAEVNCGAMLDPFNFLCSNARTISSAWSSYREVTRRANEIAERVHELKKEEARLRAMVKRLQEKSGAVLSVRAKDQ